MDHHKSSTFVESFLGGEFIQHRFLFRSSNGFLTNALLLLRRALSRDVIVLSVAEGSSISFSSTVEPR